MVRAISDAVDELGVWWRRATSCHITDTALGEMLMSRLTMLRPSPAFLRLWIRRLDELLAAIEREDAAVLRDTARRKD